MKFRYDINALRALAVIGVILFHFKVPYFDGGFSGVDIFFVISGYLMSRIIINAINKNEFSFIDFYGKRLKRIVPALLFLITIITFACFFFYFPQDYQVNEKNAASSVLFLSNMWFWKNTGYFDPASDTNILLHTWSLSVEWQFYLLYPVVLVVLHKVFKLSRGFFWFLIIATGVIFLGAAKATQKNATASFYFLPTRSWEMLFGGIAFYAESMIKNLKWKNLVAVAGYLLLLVCMVIFKSSMPWPGKYTLVPVLLTFLIIIADYNCFGIIKNKVIQFIGSISYSLYLWHWPVYVISEYLGVNKSPLSITLLILLSVGLAYFSYRYVESFKYRSNPAILTAMVVLIMVTAALGNININYVIFKKKALEVSGSTQSKTLERDKQFSDGCCFININSKRTGKSVFDKVRCLAVSNTQKNFLLIGDSHAAQYSQSLREKLAMSNMNLIQASASACFPLIKKNGASRCYEIIDYIYKDFVAKNAKQINGIILCANWISMKGGDKKMLVKDLNNTINYLNKFHIKTVILGQNETYDIPYKTIAAKEVQYDSRLSRNHRTDISYKTNEYLSKNLTAYYINIYNEKNVPPLSKESEPYMFDENHFTKYGADIATQKILVNPIMKNFLYQ